jgi:NADH:ubiquinone oxidoreductase subunit C
MNAEELRGQVGEGWIERSGGFCHPAPTEQIPRIAQQMRDAGARFVTLVGVQSVVRTLSLCWYFDLHGSLMGIETMLADGDAAPSVADIYPGADWAEREARDYFGISFTGRETTAPLMLRAEDSPGVLLRDEGSRT